MGARDDAARFEPLDERTSDTAARPKLPGLWEVR